jgi:hypothetical protein
MHWRDHGPFARSASPSGPAGSGRRQGRHAASSIGARGAHRRHRPFAFASGRLDGDGGIGEFHPNPCRCRATLRCECRDAKELLRLRLIRPLGSRTGKVDSTIEAPCARASDADHIGNPIHRNAACPDAGSRLLPMTCGPLVFGRRDRRVCPRCRGERAGCT